MLPVLDDRLVQHLDRRVSCTTAQLHTYLEATLRLGAWRAGPGVSSTLDKESISLVDQESRGPGLIVADVITQLTVVTEETPHG